MDVASNLPPSGKDRVATQHDLELFAVRIEANIAAAVAASNAAVCQLRADLRADMSELRAGLRGEISDTRASLRSEMVTMKVELREEISGLRSKMDRLSTNMKWLLGIAGAIGTMSLGVIGSAIGYLLFRR